MCVSVVVMVTFVMGLQSIAGMLSPVNDLDCDGNWLLYTEGKLFMKTIDVFFFFAFFSFLFLLVCLLTVLFYVNISFGVCDR